MKTLSKQQEYPMFTNKDTRYNGIHTHKKHADTELMTVVINWFKKMKESDEGFAMIPREKEKENENEKNI